MIRYTGPQQGKPAGREWHGPGSLKRLDRYHEADSFKGVDEAVAHHCQFIDLDRRFTLDGVAVGAHSDHTPQWEGFAATGVALRVLSKMPWRLVRKLRRKDGYVIRRYDDLLAYAHRKGLGVAIDLKMPLSDKQADDLVATLNRIGMRAYGKCDPKRPALVKSLNKLQARGLWTRFDGTKDWRAPAAATAPVPAPSPTPAPVVKPVDKFAPPSPPFIPARWHGGSQTPRTIVMHSTVGPTKAGSAKGVAEFFAREDNKTSAHYVVDAAEVYQCVGDHTVAYHCGHNQDSIGVEMCDMPVQGDGSRWNDADHRAMLNRTATLVAQLCLAYNIRPVFVDVDGLKAGEHGITTHANMSAAFKQSTHWDPGAWPMETFVANVKAEIQRLKRAAA